MMNLEIFHASQKKRVREGKLYNLVPLDILMV